MSVKNSYQTLTLAALALLLLGCGGGYFEVTLVPEGQSLRRELSYTSAAKVTDAESTEEESQDVDHQTAEEEAPPEVKLLADAYGTPIPEPTEGRYRFTGTFSGAMPDDVGGAGFFSRKETSLGALCVYSERFRGSYEQSVTLEKRYEKIETLTALLADWVRVSGQESPLRDRLEKLVAHELQRDLKNAVVLLMTLSAKQSEWDDEEAMVHLAQYFYERGYIDLDLILNGRWAGDSPALVLSQFRRGLVLKLRLDSEQPLLQTWPALADVEKIRISLNEAVESTDTFQQYATEMADKEDESEPAEGIDLLESLLWEISGLELEARDSLTVYLECPHEPILTNGEWLSDEHRLRWQGSLATRDSSVADHLPVLCYATWCEPNPDFQQRHFGRVLLKGDALATYCSWRASLSAQEGPEWDRFLEELTAGDDLSGALSEFAFSGEADTSSPAARRIDEIRELLKDALRPREVVAP